MSKRIILLITIILLLTSCADTVTFTAAQNIEPVGFWHGLWHGIILPISWFIGLFDSDVAIYAIYNNGGWYDFGFFLGTSISFCSGGSATS